MKTTSLIYKADKILKGQHIFVTIRLNDECKNGHQDFAITADIYEAGKPKTDRYHLSGGCCHEEILKAFPEFKIFVDLHLCDYLGHPMYAIANGFYHLTEGFNNAKPNNLKFKGQFCTYYRITGEQFNILSTSNSKIEYAINILDLGIPSVWKKQADKAIKTLESLTGDKFIVDSVRTQLDLPSEDAIKAEKERIKAGYYSIEAKNERQILSDKAFIKGLEDDTQKQIDKLNSELKIKKLLFSVGGKRLLDNVIYYSHNNTLGFNWRSYGERFEETEVLSVMDKINKNGLSLLHKIN